MDPKLYAALAALTRDDFAIMFGNNQLADRLFIRWYDSKAQDSLLLFVLGLTDNQRADLSQYLKLKLSEQIVEVDGVYQELHKLLSWAKNEAQCFFIKIKETSLAGDKADFSVLISKRGFDAYKSQLSHVAA